MGAASPRYRGAAVQARHPVAAGTCPPSTSVNLPTGSVIWNSATDNGTDSWAYVNNKLIGEFYNPIATPRLNYEQAEVDYHDIWMGGGSGASSALEPPGSPSPEPSPGRRTARRRRRPGRPRAAPSPRQRPRSGAVRTTRWSVTSASRAAGRPPRPGGCSARDCSPRSTPLAASWTWPGHRPASRTRTAASESVSSAVTGQC
jgi:hypothetical protein